MDSTATAINLCLTLLIILPHVIRGVVASDHGRLIGNLRSNGHRVRGTVYAVDEHTIAITGFTYDGKGPDAFFWMGTTQQPSSEGTLIPYPVTLTMSNSSPLGAYEDKDVILRIPAGKTILDFKWLAVWCRSFLANFGDIFIPPYLEIPRPHILPEFSRLAHKLKSGNITVINSKTFRIPNLYYDGSAPTAFFWVGKGSAPNAQGRKVPNEKNSLEPVKGYNGETVEITLPADLTVHDIDYLGMWCVKFTQNFGYVAIPKNMNVPPYMGQSKLPLPQAQGNCRELIPGRLQVQWQVVENQVHIQLVGRMRDDEYMAFGLSGEDGIAKMRNGDVVVTFYEKETNTFQAVDYYISSYSQCDGEAGVCPDERVGGVNDAVLVSGSRSNDVTMIKYTRPLQTAEQVNDRPIPLNQGVSVIAAIGPLNSRREANAHSLTDMNRADIRINFSTLNDNTCTKSLFEKASETPLKAWPAAAIWKENEFKVRIGPTGGRRGYTPITGLPSWGIAWWINDLLIPEIYVERGQTYTFIVEGGKNDSTYNPAQYHPFYITSSNEGGFGQKTAEERQNEDIYAGVGQDPNNQPYPTAAGRYCEYVHKTVDRSAESETFSDYVKTVELKCHDGKAAVLQWTVAPITPDNLYYQCYTHNNLGWKIRVVNKGFPYPQTNWGGKTNSSRQLIGILLVVSMAVTFGSR